MMKGACTKQLKLEEKMLLLEKALRAYLENSVPALEQMPDIRFGKPVFVVEKVRLVSRDRTIDNVVYVLGKERKFKVYKKGGILVAEPRDNIVYLDCSQEEKSLSQELRIKTASPADILRYERIESYPERTILSPYATSEWAVAVPENLASRLPDKSEPE